SDCNLKAICISHFHSDHCGGLFELLKRHSVPVLIAEITLNYLLVLPNISYEDKLNLAVNAVVLERLIYGKIFRNCLDFFPVFHCPGSAGFVYKGFPGDSVYYLGDVCLKNGFLDFRSTVDRMIAEDKNDKKHIVIDAALIGKSNFTIDLDDIPIVLLQDVVEIARKRNVIFVSNSVETLQYSYILFFIYSNVKVWNSLKLSVNDDLYNIIKSLWGPVILSQKGSAIDPFVKNVLHGSRCNFAETQRLYPLSSLHSIDDREKIASFVTMSDVDNNIQIQNRIKSSDVILLGHWTMKASIPESVAQLKPRSVLRVSSPDWSFHTSESDIAEAINTWNQLGAETILFHNYSKVLRKFSKSLPNTNYIQNCIKI
ncbi:MAG: MBL fold metallo-hydrolase, partial [Oscillospiraceae bacterium]|nr:MBL fold metallo-hydrolase [Oscillospiraceae bacterium]